MDHSPRHESSFQSLDLDYAGLGFICGLEVHHQILTNRKLFCHCPAGRYSTEVDAEMLRHMRPTLSELGEYDPCALMEFKRKKFDRIPAEQGFGLHLRDG
jgi:glutamyl-tRNA(Gln) amidotransferase subunit E